MMQHDLRIKKEWQQTERESGRNTGIEGTLTLTLTETDSNW